MCLSTVYVRPGEKAPLARNVARVRSRDGKLLFTDILGVTTEADAEIVDVDLLENVIYIRRKQDA